MISTRDLYGNDSIGSNGLHSLIHPWMIWCRQSWKEKWNDRHDRISNSRHEKFVELKIGRRKIKRKKEGRNKGGVTMPVADSPYITIVIHDRKSGWKERKKRRRRGQTTSRESSQWQMSKENGELAVRWWRYWHGAHLPYRAHPQQSRRPIGALTR